MFLVILDENDSIGCRLLRYAEADNSTAGTKNAPTVGKKPVQNLAGAAHVVRAAVPKADVVCCECGYAIGDAEREKYACISNLFFCSPNARQPLKEWSIKG